ncbi:MAG: hypothetical protein WAV24_02495 [Methanothrix sp.]
MAGLLLIFLLSGPVLAGPPPGHPAGPITSSEIADALHKPSRCLPFSASPRDNISCQRERALMDEANLRAKLENLSAAYSQESRQTACHPPEGRENSSEQNLPGGAGPGSSLENRLDIKVIGISVRAINTVEGGKAAAISNIIIEPVQIINLAPQGADKLR